MGAIKEDVHFFVSRIPALLPPDKDLTKHTREMKKRRKQKEEKDREATAARERSERTSEKPEVPKHIVSSRPKTAAKNYVEENMQKVKELKPKLPIPRYVDYCTGHQHYFDYEIEIRKRMNSVSYGKPPKYLQKEMKKIQAGKEHLGKEKKDAEKQLSKTHGLKELEPISTEVKENLLKELHARKTELQREFLCLPFIIDTVPNIKRASRLERQLQQLEKDIDALERHGDIYIIPDRNFS